MTCPNCSLRIPLKAVMSATGLSGVVCPHCNTSLEVTYWSSAALLILSFGLGEVASAMVQRAGFDRWLGLLGLVVTVFAAYALFAGMLLHFRVKPTKTLFSHSKS